MAGKVFSKNKKLEKPGMVFPENIPLEIKTKEHPWVSRGGIKLNHAIKHFAIPVENKICLDIGASTGGFTDVLLHHGAQKIYAVDVGYGELAWKLRNDARVIVMERTNARNLSQELIPDNIGIIVCDASFIGLKTILPAPMQLAGHGCFLVALIKPQFEVAKHQVGEGGIIRDEKLHMEVCEDIKNWLANQPKWRVVDVAASPILGMEGNKEFLIAAQYD